MAPGSAPLSTPPCSENFLLGVPTAAPSLPSPDSAGSCALTSLPVSTEALTVPSPSWPRVISAEPAPGVLFKKHTLSHGTT